VSIDTASGKAYGAAQSAPTMLLLNRVTEVALIASGIFLIYLGWFTYTDEDKQLQNRAEDLWFRVDELRRRGLGRHEALLLVVAARTRTIIDRLLGPSLLSLRAIGVSLCLNGGYFVFLLFLFIVLFLSPTRPFSDDPSTVEIVFTIFMYATLLVLAACLPAWRPSLWPIPVFLSVLHIVVIIAYFLNPGKEEYINVGTFFGAALIASCVSNIALVAIIRRLVLRAERTSGHVLSVAVLIALILVIEGIPMFATRNSSEGPITSGLALPFGIMAANSLNALLALSIVAVMTALAAHRLFWSLITRPLYRFANDRLILDWKVKTAVVAAGVTLIGVASPWFKALLTQVGFPGK